MNEYLSRSDIAPVDRTARTHAVVAGVHASTQFGADAKAALSGHADKAKAGADLASGSEDQLASAAEYVRIHARIADIMANLRAGAAPSAPTSAGESAAEITALLPEPVIIVPLPPASKDMVERAEALARDMANQAAVTRAAQSHVKPGTVDQILATAA